MKNTLFVARHINNSLSFEWLLLLCSRVAIYSFNILGQRSVVELEQWNVDSPQVGEVSSICQEIPTHGKGEYFL